jgi:transposase
MYRKPFTARKVKRALSLSSYISPEARVPADHPLRQIRELVREVLKDLSRSFGKLYSNEGRPSIPPEQLLSALLLQAFYSIRSERQLMEQLDYILLYRWFVGLSPDDRVWDPTRFTKNRERLQKGDVFQKFMRKLLALPQVKPLLSDEHFSVDGTLIEAWASQKSFRRKDGDGDEGDGSDFHNQKRKNDTHVSVTDPDCRLYKKAEGREAKLCYMGHVLMENRSLSWRARSPKPPVSLSVRPRRLCSRPKPRKQAKGSFNLIHHVGRAKEAADMALSDDLRERVVRAVVDEGMSRNAAAKRFAAVSPARCAGWRASRPRARFPPLRWAGIAARSAEKRTAIICWGSITASRI